MPDRLIDDVVNLASTCALQGGGLLRRGLTGVDGEREVLQEKSFATDIATRTDLAIQHAIVRRIRARFPDDDFVLEEGEASQARRKNRPWRWIIDPLDGTSNFVRGMWPSAISIAVEYDTQVIAGVVYEPVHDELYVAIAGKGATCNGRPIHGGSVGMLAHAFVSIGGAEPRNQDPCRPSVMKVMAEQADSVRDLGATALQLCYVANGRVDAHISLSVQHWDVAAGFLIAREAGCAFRTIESLSPFSAIVCNPDLLDEVASAVATACS